MSFAETISTLAAPLLEEVIQDYIPVEYNNFEIGFQTWNSQNPNEGVLNPPIAGYSRGLEREPGLEIQLEGDRFVLRTVIGYSMAASSITNPNSFIIKVSTLINSMTGAAYKVYGSRIIKMTFDRFDNPGAYFTELEHNAGYELRLSGEITPLLEMEDV